MDIPIIQQALQKFNLSPEEALVYIHLLKLGEATVAHLAELSDLKRPSTYNYVDSLVKKGLAQYNETMQGKTVLAKDPQNLELQVNSWKEKYQEAQNSYETLLPELNALKARKNFATQVKYYEGVSGLQKMITNTLMAKNHLYGYSYFARNRVLGKKFMKDFREKWVEAKIMDHVIGNDEGIRKSYPKEVMVLEDLKYQELRVLPKEEFYISSDSMIYNNVYAVANMDIKNPVGVEIINEEIVKTQMSIFQQLWKVAKPAKWEV